MISLCPNLAGDGDIIQMMTIPLVICVLLTKERNKIHSNHIILTLDSQVAEHKY